MRKSSTPCRQPQLPRADAAERYLVSCLVGWPERACEVLPLVEPADFFDELHEQLWRLWRTQIIAAEIDVLTAGRELDCCAYLLACGYDATTTAFSEIMAKCVRDAARARRLHGTLNDAANELMRGQPVESVLPLVTMGIDTVVGATA